MTLTIAVVNRSPHVSSDDAELMIQACNEQFDRHVRPVWGGPPCIVRLYPSAARVPRGSLAIVIHAKYVNAEDRDGGYLGYHTENSRGVRWGRVYTDPILAGPDGSLMGRGNSVSVTLSHEVIEAYVDPDVNLWAEGTRRTYWAYEACDPVEGTSYSVRVGGRLVGVSDFVYPAWFDVQQSRHARFDHLRRIRGPFGVLDEGYAVYIQGGRTRTRWGTRYNRERKRIKLEAKESPLARTARRLRGL